MAKTPNAIGKYRVISEVARGGMGAVYTAAHPTLDRTVIIKKLTMRGSAAVRERFRREASIMMDFRNEFIVDVFDHFREGPAYYIVQEYVDGLSLSDLLKRERYLPERVALLIFRDCCRALKYAHDRGVIHRDIKPGNILLSRSGDVKLVDFGIAHVDDESEQALTREGTMLGTPSYMAPEQFQDTRSVDKRADIYSLGVMLYEMVTGKRPFSGTVNAETLRAIQHGKYRKPRRHNPAITRFTARTIRRAMSARRSRRFQDLSELLRRLDVRFGARSVGEQKPEIASFLAGTWMPPRGRSRAGRAILTAAACVLIVAAAAFYYGYSTGMLYELVQPQRYGALTVTVRVSGRTQSARDLSVAAELFRDDGKGIPRVEGARFSFSLDPRQTTRETAVYTSRRLYLAAGQYRLKVMAAGELVWRGFYLQSHARQARSVDRTEGRNLIVPIGKDVSLPLSVSYDVRSASNGESITASSTTEIYAHGSWVPFTPMVAVSLRSGNTYRFRFTHEGYYPAEYALAVSPFQSVLRINAELVPFPGAVELQANTSGVTLALNGSQSYRAWSRTPRPEPLPSAGPRQQTLKLAPGNYTLTVRSGSLVGERSLSVLPLRSVELKIVVDRTARKIRFETSGYRNTPGLTR